MRQIRPGVWVDDPLPAHLVQIEKEWQLTLSIGHDMPLPRSIVINGQRYLPQTPERNNEAEARQPEEDK